MNRRGFIGILARGLAVLPILRVLETFEPFVERPMVLSLEDFSRAMKQRWLPHVIADFNQKSPIIEALQRHAAAHPSRGGRSMEIQLRVR